MFGVTVQLEVPLQVWVLHVSLVQVIGVPLQTPLEHVSLYVHALPSSQPVPSALGGPEHMPVEGSQTPPS